VGSYVLAGFARQFNSLCLPKAGYQIGLTSLLLIAGAGTLTTILSLRAVYEETNVLIGILLNLIFVYLVLRSASWLERVVGKSGFAVLRRVFGVILLAISVKIFKNNLGFSM